MIRLILTSIVFCTLSCNEQGTLKAKNNKIAGVNIYDGKRLEFNGKLEPPAPDPIENDKTLLGIDSNNDGVRDDVERWINRKANNNQFFRFLLRLEAKSRANRFRNLKLNSEDTYNLIKRDLYVISACELEIVSLDKKINRDKFNLYISELRYVFENTKERVMEASKIMKKISGKSFVSPNKKNARKICSLEERMKND